MTQKKERDYERAPQRRRRRRGERGDRKKKEKKKKKTVKISREMNNRFDSNGKF